MKRIKNISFDIHDIKLFGIHDLEIVYQLIPSNTKDEIHLKIFIYKFFKESQSRYPNTLHFFINI